MLDKHCETIEKMIGQGLRNGLRNVEKGQRDPEPKKKKNMKEFTSKSRRDEAPLRFALRRGHPYARKTASQAARSRMQLIPHAARPTPPGAWRLAKAMPAWSEKT